MTPEEKTFLLSKASPTPWYFDGRDIFSESFQENGHRLVVPLPDTWHPSQGVSEFDARLIVAAVNEFAERHA